MGGNDYFFQIKNLEASDSAVVPRWKDEEMLPYIFSSQEKTVLDTNGDDDNAMTHTFILQASQTPSAASSRAAALL